MNLPCIRREQHLDDIGYHYYVWFKPDIPREDEIRDRMPVEASLSLSETGELADVTFIVPKPCRSEAALTFIRRHQHASYVAPRVFMSVPGKNGDAVASAAANLELDLAGRIIAMEIHWSPLEPGEA